MSYLKNFEYSVVGSDSSPKLVFLHGLMGFAANWKRIATSLQNEFQVLCYDQRGHGRSFKPAEGYRPEDYADDLRLILDELNWPSVYLVGHSMGGRNALNFASRYPQQVLRLVIEDIGPAPNPQAALKIRQLLDSIPTPFASRAEAKTYFLNDFVRNSKHWRNPASLGQYLYANIIEEDGTGRADWRFSKAAILISLQEGLEKDRWDEVRELSCPTLIIRGEHSDELPINTYVKMLEANPLLQGLEVHDAGHWVHFDQPELFTKALREFFRS